MGKGGVGDKRSLMRYDHSLLFLSVGDKNIEKLLIEQEAALSCRNLECRSHYL